MFNIQCDLRELAGYFKAGLKKAKAETKQPSQTESQEKIEQSQSDKAEEVKQATPKTDTTLICQSDAATPTEIENTCEHSLPLSWKQWARDVFDMDEKTLRNIRKSENPIYHFRKTHPKGRKWTLPIHELPAEYLERYRNQIKKTTP